jgi:hypothetical protein
MNELVDFISEDLKNYMEQEHLEFTDSEMATLICNSFLPAHEISSRLEIIAEKTVDAALKSQIREHLLFEKEDMEAYLNNTDGYMYSVKSFEYDEPYICGYFANHSLAYGCGMKQGVSFSIEKFRIIGNSRNSDHDGAVTEAGTQAAEEAPIKPRLYMNPYIFDDRTVEECVEEYDDYYEAVSVADYDEAGTLISFRSNEIKRDDKLELERTFSPEHFKNSFMYIAHPFERGDIVRLVNEKDAHGMVATSGKEWKQFLEDVKGGRYKGVDFIDSTLEVEFIQSTGDISHSHINPAFLEKYVPDKQDEDYQLLMAGSSLLKGRGGLDWFLTCYEEFKDKKTHITKNI